MEHSLKANTCAFIWFFVNILYLTRNGCSCRTGVTITQITEPGGWTAGLFWNNNTLFYVEKTKFQIHRLNPSTQEEQVINLGGFPAFVIPTRCDARRFVTTEGKDLLDLYWEYDGNNYYNTCVLATVEPEVPNSIWSDGKADVKGIVYSGTIAPDSNGNYAPNRSLYRANTLVTGQLTLEVALNPVTLSNGLTWSADDRKFYFVDSSGPGCVFSYDYDVQTSRLSNGAVVICFAYVGLPGFPTGLALDTHNNIWTAAFGSGLIVNFNPYTKKVLRTITVSASSGLTDCVFGGTHFDVLYVSSKNQGNASEPLAGAVFGISGLGVHGVPDYLAVVNSDCIG